MPNLVTARVYFLLDFNLGHYKVYFGSDWLMTKLKQAEDMELTSVPLVPSLSHECVSFVWILVGVQTPDWSPSHCVAIACRRADVDKGSFSVGEPPQPAT